MDNPINVTEIMSNLRIMIKENGYSEEMLSFDDIKPVDEVEERFVLKRLQNYVFQFGTMSQIEWNRLLPGNRIVRFIKKTIRKSIAFAVEPLVVEQSMVNEQNRLIMDQLLAFAQEQDKLNKEYCKKIAELEAHIKELEND